MHSIYKYSHEWASDVVLAFYEKHTRATETLSLIAGITVERLLKYLSLLVRKENQVQWRAFKIIIKGMRDEHYRDFKHISIEDRRKYLRIVKYNAQSLAIDQLAGETGLDTAKLQRILF